MPRPLSKNFFSQDTTTVARELLGMHLVRILPNGKRLSGKIVETEAYIGIEDAASHSFGARRTTRVASMYLNGGHAYVYLIYGLHYCLNVVTRRTEDPQAVLIRALEPLEGIEEIRRRRHVANDRNLTNGPGKLCEAFAIDRDFDGHFLTEKPLFIERGEKIKTSQIVSGPRIGVDYAGAASSWPLRFFVKENPYVSQTPRKTPRPS